LIHQFNIKLIAYHGLKTFKHRIPELKHFTLRIYTSEDNDGAGN